MGAIVVDGGGAIALGVIEGGEFFEEVEVEEEEEEEEEVEEEEEEEEEVETLPTRSISDSVNCHLTVLQS